MSHKLYMAMRNMIALAIPGDDWTDPAGEQALEDAHAACLDYEDRLANVRDWPNPDHLLLNMFRLREHAAGGTWKANLQDGTLEIPGRDTVQFSDGYDAAFCAAARNGVASFFQYLGDILNTLDALRNAKLADDDTIARQEQTIAAQSYIIAKLDDIIYAVQHPDGIRLVAEMHARQVAERRVTELEMHLRKLREGDHHA